MLLEDQIWTPGSFTKNFSWGRTIGLRRLHESIRVGFNNTLEDVPRQLFIDRLHRHTWNDESIQKRRAYQIPTNFFLFNEIKNRASYIIVDELVFRAITADHDADFDCLALFALNFSRAGIWKGAKTDQRYPSLWANHYVINRVNRDFSWETSRINAKDIERFVAADRRYKGEPPGKLSTNLFFIYQMGQFERYKSKKVERWWVDAVFLALDRLVRDSGLDGNVLPRDQLLSALTRSKFSPLTGPESLEKGLALSHLIRLYDLCGADKRFSPTYVEELNSTLLNHISNYVDPANVTAGAIHPTNPRILKVIPRVCAMLARYAGFLTFDEEELSTLDVQDLIRRRTREGLDRIREKRVITNMSADELMRLTRH